MYDILTHGGSPLCTIGYEVRLMIVGAIVVLGLSMIALLDGVSNAASFISIAMGSNRLSTGRVLLYASLGEAVGIAVLGPRIYADIADRMALGFGPVNPGAVALGLVLALLWILCALASKAVAPISVAILGVLLGASSNGFVPYIARASIYVGLWVAQIALAVLTAALLVRMQSKLRQGLEMAAVAVSLSTLSMLVSIAYGLGLPVAAMFVAIAAAAPLVAKRLNALDRVSIAVPLFVAAIAHGMNDSALMLGVAGLSKVFSEGFLGYACSSIPMLILLGVVLWSRRVSAVLAKSITLIDVDTARCLYVSLFTTTVVFNLLGVPAPITFSTLGSMVGVGVGRGFRVLNVRAIAKLIAIALATLVAVSIPLQIAKLLWWGGLL